MHWPRLVESPVLLFPVTQQGQQSAAYIPVKNHASKPVWLQLVDHSDDFLSARVDARPLTDSTDDAKLEVRPLSGGRSRGRRRGARAAGRGGCTVGAATHGEAARTRLRTCHRH